MRGERVERAAGLRERRQPAERLGRPAHAAQPPDRRRCRSLRALVFVIVEGGEVSVKIMRCVACCTPVIEIFVVVVVVVGIQREFVSLLVIQSPFLVIVTELKFR